jgi:hypothetical protein
MTHWFDTLSKKAAGFDGVERRSFLAFGTLFGLGALDGRAEAAVAAGHPGKTPPAIRAADEPVLVQNALGSFSRRTAGALVIHEVSTAKSGLSLKSSMAFNRQTQNSTISATISKGSDLVAKLDIATAKGGAGTIQINYGKAYSDVQYVTMSTKNGKTFQGTADGRAFTIAGSQVEFLDHGATPHLVHDPAMVASIRDLDVQQKTLFHATSSAVSAAPAPAPKPRAELNLRYVGRRSPRDINECGTHRPIISAPGEEWYEPGVPFQDCNNCEDSCGSNVGSWILDIFSGGSYEPEYYAACMAACYIPGGGCLPTPCGSFQSCASSDTCFQFQGGNLCCPSPSAICKGACCGADITTCGSDGTCGCQVGSTVCEQDCCFEGQACCNGTCCGVGEACCNGTCCQKGQVCTNGVCCKPGVVTCEGICCDSGQVCHGGKCCKTANFCGPTCCDELATCLDASKGACCGFDQPKCGGVCCPLGALCLNGKCCEPNSVCGGVCCPAGETCVNPVTHACTKCPDGKYPCLSTNGKGLCCAQDVECCGDTCCSPGQVCQASGNTYVCAAATPIQ